MPEIQMNEELFNAAQRRAVESGYANVDEYIADVVAEDLTEMGSDDTDLQHLFTPERMAIILAAAEEVKAGKFYTTEQAEVEFAKYREQWLAKNHH